jgi:hypothetical protein
MKKKNLYLLAAPLLILTAISCTKDENCTESTFYRDNDDDGLGNPSNMVSACANPDKDKYVTNSSDTDDTDVNVPNCSTELTTYYFDGDGDTFGDPNNSKDFCGEPDAKYVLDNTDSDDTDVNVPNCSVELTTYYYDGDGDTFGDPENSMGFCGEPDANYVLDNTDCNDNDASINPEDTITYYEDLDQDGLGNPEVSQTKPSCEMAPDGYVLDNTDCDDTLNSFTAADWVGTYDVTRTSYSQNGTTSTTNYTCTVAQVDGSPNTIKLIGFWSSGYPDSEIIIEIGPTCQKLATWNQNVAIDFYSQEPYIGDIHWERSERNDAFSINDVTLNPNEDYGWCTLNANDLSFQLYGLATIPEHDVFFSHYLVSATKQ